METDKILASAGAFSAEGFIISQKKTAGLKYGRKSSADNGCGWIAAYNFLHCAGYEISCDDVIKSLSRTLFFGGGRGTSFPAVLFYLRRRGCRLRIACTRRSALRRCESSARGVIMYYHRRGGHFVSYEHAQGVLYRFFGLSDGTVPLMSMEHFFKTYPKFALLAAAYSVEDDGK